MEKSSFKDELYEVLVSERGRIIRMFIMLLILLVIVIFFGGSSEQGSFIYEQF